MIGSKETEIKLRAEDELLLCCARTEVDSETRDKILSLTSNALDWEYLVQMAMRHRLMPLLYYNLNSVGAEKVPGDVLGRLREESHDTLRNNLLFIRELVEILNLFKLNGMNAITYKGPILASLAYDNIGFRQFGDVDVLIDKRDALKAKELLLSNGYELTPPIKVSHDYYMKLDSEYRFINKKTKAKIEINWNFEGTFFSFPDDPGFLFNDFKEIRINGLEFKTFSSVNQLIMLCIHSAKHDWTRLSWICDISEFIKKNDINWQEAFDKSKKLGVKRILLINLFLVKDLLGLELPDDTLSYLNSHIVKSISFQIEKYIFTGKKSPNLFRKFSFDMRKRDKKLTGMKDSFNGLTKPTCDDFKDISLPEFLYPVYYLIRPILLLRRYGIV